MPYVCGVMVEGSDWVVAAARGVEAVFAVLTGNAVDGVKGGCNDWRGRGSGGEGDVGWLCGIRCVVSSRTSLWRIVGVVGRWYARLCDCCSRYMSGLAVRVKNLLFGVVDVPDCGGVYELGESVRGGNGFE